MAPSCFEDFRFQQIRISTDLFALLSIQTFRTRNRFPTPSESIELNVFLLLMKHRRTSRFCLHHEMAQTPVYPSRLFFFCEQPAEQGGATPLCRSDVLFERLKEEFPEFVGDCETKGLLYTNIMPVENDPTSGMGRSWQSTFRAETPEAAEDQPAKTWVIVGMASGWMSSQHDSGITGSHGNRTRPQGFL